MSTMMGYMLGRTSVHHEQSLARIAESMAGVPSEEDLVRMVHNLRAQVRDLHADNENVRGIALRNKEINDANHASAKRWKGEAQSLAAKAQIDAARIAQLEAQASLTHGRIVALETDLAKAHDDLNIAKDTIDILRM